MDPVDCHCSLWNTKPDLLAARGLPPGYCGHCEVCGQPGHARHFPGPSPTTGAWCERHYRRLLWLHPMGWYGRRLYAWVAAAALLACLIWRA